MSHVRCFMLQDLPFERLWLRRYADGPCPQMPGEYSYHHAMVLYRERARAEKGPDERFGYVTIRSLETPPPDDDPRWPTHCGCGFEFPPGTCHQLFPRQIWRRSDTGEEIVLEDAAVGAMWDAWWISDGRRDRYKGPGSFVGPDGLSLMVKTPAGREWFIDGPASNGPGWRRSGTAPEITATPSILINASGARPGYHGFLTAGVLTPC